MKRDPLLDKDFLLKLDNDRNRLVYVKLVALDLDENPLEEINGRVTSGSINLDGSSAVRRTCSLSLVANELDINDFYWGLKSKFKCFIGLENRIDPKYPDIIYFPMGTYIVNTFTTSQNLNQYTVSIQGKDKMCLLNGDIGGNITAISVDFGQLTEQKIDGSLVKTKLLLKDIIREAVKEYAHEPAHNIIVNDLDEAALELMEYRGDTPLYLIYDNLVGEVTNNALSMQNIYYIHTGENSYQSITIADMEEDTDSYHFDHRIELNFESKRNDATRLYDTAAAAKAGGDNYYTICKAEYGDVVGYRLTDLVYAGDLIGNVGESITSIFDKIKNMLGDYEYFYNLEGQFVWQRKPTYINVSWNNITQNEGDPVHGESASYTSAVTYSFENHNLISSVSNNPTLNNIKNDYSIFGQKTLSSGAQIPIHLRYAIDKKPIAYRSYDGILYSTEEIPQEQKIIIASHPKSKEEIEQILATYQKQELPPGLDDDWWDVYDWGEYYKQLTGEYPDDGMYAYKTATTKVDLMRYFPRGTYEDYPADYNYARYPAWNYNQECFLFDTINGMLGFTGHNPYCGHRYHTYFMAYYEKYAAQGYDFHAYIYKPEIPSAVISDVLQGAYTVYDYEKEQIVDWREIIYRMASDYMKHGTQDANNYEPVDYNNVVLSQSEIDKEIYYIKKEVYFRALEWVPNRDYYIKDRYGKYVIPDTPLTESVATKDNFFTANEYYFRRVEDKFELVKTYQSNFQQVSVTAGTYEKNVFYIKQEDGTYILSKTDFKTGTSYYKKKFDYYVYVDFNYRLRTYNPEWYPDGVTGYEQYYTDIISFWRDLYDPDYVGTYNVAGITKKLYYKDGSKYYWFKCQNDSPYQENTVYFTQDISGTWRARKNVTQNDFENNSQYYFLPIQGQDNVTEESSLSDDLKFKSARTYYTFETGQYYPATELDEEGQTVAHPYAYWNIDIWNKPEDLVFWFDFLDTEGELSQFSIPRIGDRPKAENNTDIKAIYYRETPNVIFVNTDEEKLSLKATKPGYTFISLNNNIDHLFRISSRKQSCNDKLNTLLYQCAVAQENITLTSIPIFYLQPNTRIFVTDEKSKINGEYIVSKLGFSLTYNGTMSITATKAIDRIY